MSFLPTGLLLRVFCKAILKPGGLCEFCRIVKAEAGSDCTRAEESTVCPGLISREGPTLVCDWQHVEGQVII